MSPYAWTWLVAFVWTCAIELPIYAAGLRRHVRPWWGVAGLSLLVNVITHPLLWFAFPRFHPDALWLMTAEGLVWTIESLLSIAALYLFSTPMTFSHAVALGASTALVANVVSTAVGWLGSFLLNSAGVRL